MYADQMKMATYPSHRFPKKRNWTTLIVAKNAKFTIQVPSISDYS